MMPEKSLLDEAADAVYRDLDAVGGDPLKLSPEVQPIAILYTVQAIVDNGGFRYLFENDYAQPYSVFAAAYRQIGANDAADKLERAVARFPFENPHTDQEARIEFMDSLDESDELFVLGDQVCGDERIWELMEEYVRSRPESFP
jgi:Domain of unknown function (DUF4375)